MDYTDVRLDMFYCIHFYPSVHALKCGGHCLIHTNDDTCTVQCNLYINR